MNSGSKIEELTKENQALKEQIAEYENNPLTLDVSREVWGDQFKWYFWGSFHIDYYIQVGTEVNTVPQVRNSIVGLMEYEAFNTRELNAVIAVQIVHIVDGFRQARLLVYQGDMFGFYRSMSVGTYDSDIPYKSSSDQMYIWVGWSTVLCWPGFASMPTLRVQAHAQAPINKSIVKAASAAASGASNVSPLNSVMLNYPIDLGNRINSYIGNRHYSYESWELISEPTPTNIYHTTHYDSWWW